MQTNPKCLTATRQLRVTTPRTIARRNTRIGDSASAAIIGDMFCANAVPGKVNAEIATRALEESIFIPPF